MTADEIIIRKLAREYMVAAMDERNMENRKLHTAVNDVKMIRPVVLIGEIPFNELNYDGSLTIQCQDPVFQHVEYVLRTRLFQWKHFPADMILPPYFPVIKKYSCTGCGFETAEDTVSLDTTSAVSSHEYHDQIPDEETLVQKFHTPVVKYKEKETMEEFDKVGNAIGDILPVRLHGTRSFINPWDYIVTLRGMTPVLTDLIEEPEFSHHLAACMRDYFVSLSEQKEKEGLYELDTLDIHCTSALNSTLPGECDGGPAKRSQVWGRAMAQSFAVVSKAMHDEFDITYMKDILKPFGLVYYGCCEPLDKKVDILEKIPNLRKISITPWADVDCAAEVIGDRYVIANKPNPALVSGTLDEDELRKEVKRTLDACKRNNCSFDMVLKDISTVNYDVNNLIRWEQIVMEMVRQY